jgi:hypothetical protein
MVLPIAVCITGIVHSALHLIHRRERRVSETGFLPFLRQKVEVPTQMELTEVTLVTGQVNVCKSLLFNNLKLQTALIPKNLSVTFNGSCWQLINLRRSPLRYRLGIFRMQNYLPGDFNACKSKKRWVTQLSTNLIHLTLSCKCRNVFTAMYL